MLFLLIDGGIVFLRFITIFATLLLVRTSIDARLSLITTASLVFTVVLAGALMGTHITPYGAGALVALTSVFFAITAFASPGATRERMHLSTLSALALSCMTVFTSGVTFRTSCIDGELRKELPLVGTIIQSSRESQESMTRTTVAIESIGGQYAPTTLTCIIPQPLTPGSDIFLTAYRYYPAKTPEGSGSCLPRPGGLHALSHAPPGACGERGIARIEGALSPPARELFHSLLLGVTQYDGSSESAAWGVAHLLARSGLHLALGAILFHIATGPFLLLTLVFLALYSSLSEDSPSFLRASLLWAAVLIAGPYLGRPLHPSALTALTGSALLIIDPLLARTLAWQLSTILAAFLLHIRLLLPPRFV